MSRYAAFFGSINVGNNRLSMADLRSAFEHEGFTDVETVVASGNVLFAFDGRPTAGLEEKLGKLMRARFDIDSFAAVRSRDEVAAAIDNNPFGADGAENLVHTHFLERQASAADFARLVADHSGRGAERLAMGDRALYVDYVGGVGKSKLTGPFIERRLGCKGTARSLRSLKRILEKMEA